MAGTLEPTAEQQAIVAAASTGNHLVVQAGAGTGKTSTLKLVAKKLTGQKALYIAYNKSIAQEASSSFPEYVSCRTAHSLAFSAVGRKYVHRLNSGRQTSKRAAELLRTGWLDLGRDLRLPPDHLARIAIDTVSNFCYSADDEIRHKHVPFQNGIVGDAHNELARTVLPYARRAWSDLTNTDGMLRFDHDHYLKMWALSRPLLKVDVVMLDEAQDSNGCVAQIVQEQDSAQQIAVGDSNQQLYAWRGATDALERWNADHRLYLTQSWRFGPAVADEANRWLGQIETPLRLSGNPALQSVLTELATPKAVLCRTNAEAMSQVLTMLGEGRKVALVGGGSAIKRLAEAANDLKNGRRTSHPELYVFATWGALQDYVENEPAGRDLKPFVDLIDTHGTDVVIAAVDKLVDEKRAHSVISTSHKAKGREWDSVKIADDFTPPKDGGEIPKTDAMLAYVAVTRARLQLDRGGLSWIDEFEEEADGDDGAEANTGSGQPE
ncbi:UvrD-helicase domain-containing protein [Mycobacteroides abscessus]|uniref:UvrD-helicase domain-containing protein n=1 Tax=Mycobacteroides abscessus TaxID=36809 RepID=UPI0009258BB6|nr:UvrD-helicase domain-containing protein [Mycobacteroides abscessus]SIA17803.1 DNA/RNA helicase, superfamily I [Mycobacteroides abscessus subsp. abscessus]